MITWLFYYTDFITYMKLFLESLMLFQTDILKCQTLENKVCVA